MNSAILSGVIISSPQIRYTSDNKAISEFLLAFQDASKSAVSKQIKCLGFGGKLAESIGQLKEGQAAILVGSINITNRENNGVKTKVTEFKISALDVVPSAGNINSVRAVGRTGRVVYKSGNKCSVSLAVRRTADQTDWFDLEAWNRTGEVMSNYVQKGGLISVEGSLRFDEWSDKNTGELRSKPVILVSQLELLGMGSKKRTGGFLENLLTDI
ncbi:MAG: single-stranded DNA-binding protein [Dolichospermum sp.]